MVSSAQFAKAISAISSPFITLPILGVWTISAYSHTWNHFLLWNGTFLLLILGLPLAYIFHGVRRGHISDLHIMMREQRMAPYIVATTAAILLVLAFYLEQAPRQLIVLSYVFVLSGIVFAIITYFWKISLHAASWAGGTLVLALLVSPQLSFLLIGLPFIMWARLKRQRHTFWQTIAAVAVISICVYSGVLLA